MKCTLKLKNRILSKKVFGIQANKNHSNLNDFKSIGWQADDSSVNLLMNEIEKGDQIFDSRIINEIKTRNNSTNVNNNKILKKL